MAKEPKVRKYRSDAGEFWFSVVGANGEVVFSSEGYKTKATRDKALERLSTILATAVTVDEDDIET